MVDRGDTTGTSFTDGDVLDGYRIVKEIGSGGMGVVYAAVQESTGRRVALRSGPIRNHRRAFGG